MTSQGCAQEMPIHVLSPRISMAVCPFALYRCPNNQTEQELKQSPQAVYWVLTRIISNLVFIKVYAISKITVFYRLKSLSNLLIG